MPKRDPLTFPYPRGMRRLENLSTALKRTDRRPVTGVTQGGSSRDNSGAKVAATIAIFRQTKKRKPKE